MQTNIKKRCETILAFALVFIVISAVYIVIFAPFFSEYAAVERMNVINKELNQKYSAIAQRKKNYLNVIKELEGQEDGERLIFDFQSDAIAVAKIQTVIKAIITSSGGTVSSVMHQNEGNSKFPVPKAAFKIRLRLDSNKIQDLLFNIESNRPLLFINALKISSQTWKKQSRYEEVPVDIDLELYGFYEVSNG